VACGCQGVAVNDGDYVSDASLRALERAAAAGDGQAAARLQVERCRLGQHRPPVHWEDVLAVERIMAQHLGPCERWYWQCPACHESAEFLGRELLESGLSSTGARLYESPPWRDALAQREAARMGYRWSNGRWVGGPPDSEMDRDGYDRDRDYDMEWAE